MRLNRTVRSEQKEQAPAPPGSLRAGAPALFLASYGVDLYLIATYALEAYAEEHERAPSSTTGPNNTLINMKTAQMLCQIFILVASPLWSVFLLVYDNSVRSFGCSWLPCVINLALWYSTYAVLWPLLAEVYLVVRHMRNFNKDAPPGSDSERFDIRRNIAMFAKDLPIMVLQSIAFHLLATTIPRLAAYSAAMLLSAYSLGSFFHKRFKVLGSGERFYLLIPWEYGASAFTKGPCCSCCSCADNDIEARIREQVLTLYTMWSNVALSLGLVALGGGTFATGSAGIAALLLLVYAVSFIVVEILRCKIGARALYDTAKVAQDPNFTCKSTQNGSWTASSTTSLDHQPFSPPTDPHSTYDQHLPMAAPVPMLPPMSPATTAPLGFPPAPGFPPTWAHHAAALTTVDQPPFGNAATPPASRPASSASYPTAAAAGGGPVLAHGFPAYTNAPGYLSGPPPPAHSYPPAYQQYPTPPPPVAPAPYNGSMPYNAPMPYNAAMPPVYPSYPANA